MKHTILVTGTGGVGGIGFAIMHRLKKATKRLV